MRQRRNAVRSSTRPAIDERARLIFFTSEKSGPARRAEAWVAQVLQHRRNHRRIKLVIVDTATRPDLAERFRVSRLPTLFVVEGKVAKARLECPRGAREIAALLTPWLV
jgi:thioredoxin-like negative regulator of GroEL